MITDFNSFKKVPKEDFFSKKRLLFRAKTERHFC